MVRSGIKRIGRNWMFSIRTLREEKIDKTHHEEGSSKL